MFQQIPLSNIQEIGEELTSETHDGIVHVTASDIQFGNPLMRAVRRGSTVRRSFFQETILNDLDITETDSLQRNSFHYAVSKPNTLKKLLKGITKKTSVDEALRQEDNKTLTPIHLAAKIGNTESLEILYNYDNPLIKLKTTVRKYSVLHLVVKSKSVVAVKFVLSKAPDLMDCVDNMLQTPLHFAASLKQSSIFELLISREADTTLTDANGQLALHIAASRGLKNNVELMLREIPEFLDVQDNFGQSSLLLASKHNFPTVVKHLLAEGANYEVQDRRGFAPFDWAVVNNIPDVVRVFLDTDVWKQVVSTSHFGPRKCLSLLIENMPEMAKLLLDKCVTTEGTKGYADCQIKYDFFLLEEPADKNGGSPQFEALNAMVENESETCLRHPVSVKYVDVKWWKRGFKYSLASIIFNLLCHICLMAYTLMVIGEVNLHNVPREQSGKNITEKIPVRNSRAPNTTEVIVLRIILLILTFGIMLKDLFQLFVVQRFEYFKTVSHYFEAVMHVSVVLFLLPEEEVLSPLHVASGSIAVLCSWLTLIEYLSAVPIMGTYIIVIQTIFWTVLKIFVVVLIYLLSFATTFYVLLAEEDSFRNIPISFVSTFVAMTSGLEYNSHFLKFGWYRNIYELKMIILILFVLAISIVVNNALIGLAVGDTNEVMKTAKFVKFKRRATFVIHLEKSVNNISFLKMKEEKFLIEFPHRKKKVYEKFLNLLYFGSGIDTIDGETDENANEREMEDHTLEDHFEKAVEVKLENLRASLRTELKGIQDSIKEDLEEKMAELLEKLN